MYLVLYNSNIHSSTGRDLLQCMLGLLKPSECFCCLDFKPFTICNFQFQSFLLFLGSLLKSNEEKDNICIFRFILGTLLVVMYTPYSIINLTDDLQLDFFFQIFEFFLNGNPGITSGWKMIHYSVCCLLHGSQV